MTAELDPKLADLIRRLYESALDEGLWSGMAENLAHAFGASSANIKIYHPDQASADIVEITANFAVTESDPAWAEHWHRNDFWVHEGMRRQLYLGTSEYLVTDAELMQMGYYHEWLKPLMIHSMVGALVPLGRDGTGSIGIHRPRDAAHFDQQDVRRLGTLIPHIQLALRLRRHLHSTCMSQLMLDQALDAASVAIVAVDAEGRVQFANKLAEALLQENGALVVRAGHLRARDAQEDAELRHWIKATCLPTPSVTPGAMKLAQSGFMPLTLTFVPLVAKAHELGASSPAALVLIRGFDASTDKEASTLRQLHGLTPMEARVAIALAQGHAVEDIASLFRIGVGTVRTHLKSVMAKTGTNRQSQLVALVWSNVGPLPLHWDKPAST